MTNVFLWVFDNTEEFFTMLELDYKHLLNFLDKQESLKQF